MGGMPEFQTLKSEHAHFHKVASTVVHRADSGQNVAEETMLGSKSEFSAISSTVVTAIMAMKSKAAKHEPVSK